MKSIKQSRKDRLARRAARLLVKPTAKQLKKQKLKDQKGSKELVRKVNKELAKKCKHKFRLAGALCPVCNPDKLAKVIREEWLPAPVYVANIYLKGAEGGDEIHVQQRVKTRNPTRTFMQMQKNGFWYTYKEKPVFIFPDMIRVIQLDDIAQNPWCNDLSERESQPFHEETGCDPGYDQ